MPAAQSLSASNAYWFHADVERRLVAAASTLRRLPMPKHGRPAGFKSAAIDVVRSTVEAYGYEEARVRPPAPSPEDITRMDEALSWLLWLDAETRRIVFARSLGFSWRRVAAMDLQGRCGKTLLKVFRTGIMRIADRLNGPRANVALPPASRREAVR